MMGFESYPCSREKRISKGLRSTPAWQEEKQCSCTSTQGCPASGT